MRYSRQQISSNTKIHLLIPVSVFLAVNLPPWFGFSYIYVIFQWATFQSTLSLGGSLEFPVTYASAIVTFATATYLFKNRTKLPLIDSAIQGVGLAFAATALFEVIYQFLGYYFYPSTILGAVWPANYVLNGSWMFLAFTSIKYWSLSTRFKLTVSALAVSWGLWVALGFPQLFQNGSTTALVATSITKILSFALILSVIDFSGETKDHSA